MGGGGGGDIWRIGSGEELNRSTDGENIVTFIEAQRIRWLGHVKRVQVGEMARKVMEGKLSVGRRNGRPILRWMEDVVADRKVIKIKQLVEEMEDGEKWRLIVEEAKAH